MCVCVGGPGRVRCGPNAYGFCQIPVKSKELSSSPYEEIRVFRWHFTVSLPLQKTYQDLPTQASALMFVSLCRQVQIHLTNTPHVHPIIGPPPTHGGQLPDGRQPPAALQPSTAVQLAWRRAAVRAAAAAAAARPKAANGTTCMHRRRRRTPAAAASVDRPTTASGTAGAAIAAAAAARPPRGRAGSRSAAAAAAAATAAAAAAAAAAAGHVLRASG